MRDQKFDEHIREMAQNERFTATQSVRESLQYAMRSGAARAVHRPRRRHWPLAMAAGVAVAAMVMVFALVQPANDNWFGKEENVFLAANEAVPVTMPEVSVAVEVSANRMQAETTFSNHTGDIWLFSWDAVPADVESEVLETTQLIWLETGITLTDSTAYALTTSAERTELDVLWSYKAYRVTADVLHWMDGEWLRPEEDGYQEQQALIEDAFAAGALILAPGDWPEGTSGDMLLVLPDSFWREHPGSDALSYYQSIGALEEVASQHVTITAPGT